MVQKTDAFGAHDQLTPCQRKERHEKGSATEPNRTGGRRKRKGIGQEEGRRKAKIGKGSTKKAEACEGVCPSGEEGRREIDLGQCKNRRRE